MPWIFYRQHCLQHPVLLRSVFLLGVGVGIGVVVGVVVWWCGWC